MARQRTEAELLALAAELLPGPGALNVLVVRGEVLTVTAEPTPAPPAPAGLSAYDQAVWEVLTDQPQSSRRLARVAGHRYNSHFRDRLAVLVEAGHARHTRRGYQRVES